jgi:zinc protease
VAYRLPGYKSPDFAAGQVLADVLDSRRGNLYGLVPEGKALFAGFDGDALPEAAFGYATAAFPRGDGAAGVRDEGIIAAISRPESRRPRGGREAPEILDTEFRKNSVEGLPRRGPRRSPSKDGISGTTTLEAIRKVTVADVNRVARNTRQRDGTTAVLTRVRPGPGFGKDSGRESFAPERTKAARPGWAKKIVTTTPVLPASRVKPTDILLANGLRLIVRPETISRTVTLSGRIRSNSDLQAPAGKEGVDRVLGDLFPYGTATLDRLAFQEAQDNIAATVSAGTSFSPCRQRVRPGVRLLGRTSFPTLPEDAFRIVRRHGGAVAGSRCPGDLSRRALRQALSERRSCRHPRRNGGETFVEDVEPTARSSG